MSCLRIGFPGLGARLKLARERIGATQEATAELVGVSRMTVYRWEQDQRTVTESQLSRLSVLYEKPLNWFLSLDEGDLEPFDPRYDTARRIYRRISELPERYKTMVEQVIEDMVQGLAGTEAQVKGGG